MLGERAVGQPEGVEEGGVQLEEGGFGEGAPPGEVDAQGIEGGGASLAIWWRVSWNVFAGVGWEGRGKYRERQVVSRREFERGRGLRSCLSFRRVQGKLRGLRVRCGGRSTLVCLVIDGRIL